MKIKKVYQGAIPLNRIVNTHNESEQNTYSTKYINDTYSTRAESEKGYIMVSKSDSVEPLRWSVPKSWDKLPLEKVMNIKGDIFEAKNGTVVIKNFTGSILITAAVTYDCRVEEEYFFASIRKNQTNQVKVINHTGGNWNTVNISAILSVTDGDIIDVAVFKDMDDEVSFYNYSANFTSAPCCYMTITEI